MFELRILSQMSWERRAGNIQCELIDFGHHPMIESFPRALEFSESVNVSFVDVHINICCEVTLFMLARGPLLEHCIILERFQQ
jgi:hypothetical protein